MTKTTARYPYVMVRTPEGHLERHHEDQFFDDLTRSGNRKPWRSTERKETKERGRDRRRDEDEE